MKTLIYFICFVAFTANAQKVSVLFVGNSLTYFSDTPGKLKKMLESKGDSAYIDQCVAPGFSLWLCFDPVHGTNMLECIENKLSSRKWDYIIIQNPNDGFLNPAQEMKSTIQKFDSMAIKNGARLILFMPYLSNVFPKYYCDYNHGGEVNCSPTLYKNVRQALDSINTFVSQIEFSQPLIQSAIGEAYYQYEAKYPVKELYTADYGHPSELGAYFHACCYYYSITHSFYTSTVSTEKLSTIEQFIKTIFTIKK